MRDWRRLNRFDRLDGLDRLDRLRFDGWLLGGHRRLGSRLRHRSYGCRWCCRSGFRGWLGSSRGCLRGRRDGGLSTLHRAGEELEEVVQDRPLVGAELAVHPGDHLRGGRPGGVGRSACRFGAATQSPNQLPQPLGGSRPLFVRRFAAMRVRQLLRDFRKIDLEIVDQNVMHG